MIDGPNDLRFLTFLATKPEAAKEMYELASQIKSGDSSTPHWGHFDDLVRQHLPLVQLGDDWLDDYFLDEDNFKVDDEAAT